MIRPMLAATLEPEKMSGIPFPLWVSPKIDGIRALAINGQLFSRNGKPIPNAFVQAIAHVNNWHGFDGELIVGKSNSPTLMSDTQSAIRSVHGQPDFKYLIFDRWDRQGPWQNPTPGEIFGDHRETLQHELAHNLEDLLFWEQEYIHHGFEGLMARRPSATYKNGRSTLREFGLVKLKRFQDDEAQIIGFVERQHNTNPDERSELGYAKRSTAASGMVGYEDLGALTVRVLTGQFTGVECEVGSGFTAQQRKEIWAKQEKYFLTKITFKHFFYGAKDAPRFPIFKCFRGDL